MTKTVDSYLGFIHLVSIRLWMREFVNAAWAICPQDHFKEWKVALPIFSCESNR
jgi:hypothetical protein